MKETNSTQDDTQNPQGNNKQNKTSVDALSAEKFRQWLTLSATAMSENQAYLTQLDSDIGDADHGNNMHRGFQAVIANIPADNDIGSILKAAAMSLISNVGGAAGPLYGTMLLQASKPLMGSAQADADAVARLLENFVTGVKKRGKAEEGEKTILDTLVPASNAYRTAFEAGESMSRALELAVQAAEQGMISTVPMVATKGRASYLGERSVGHQDPGATSTYLLIQALAQAGRSDVSA